MSGGDHAHGTLLIRAGGPVKVVSERLGHNNPAFTIDPDRYYQPKGVRQPPRQRRSVT